MAKLKKKKAYKGVTAAQFRKAASGYLETGMDASLILSDKERENLDKVRNKKVSMLDRIKGLFKGK